MHQHDHITFQNAEGDEALFAVAMANIFARNREVVPDRLAFREIEAVILDP